MIPDQKHILIVEDEPAILSLLSDILGHRAGYPVLTAMNGEDAVAIYREQFLKISLVILDMNMPGMNGMETFQELKKINPSVIALISTGFSRNEKVHNILKEGVKGYIQKPFNISELLKTVENILDTDNPTAIL